MQQMNMYQPPFENDEQGEFPDSLCPISGATGGAGTPVKVPRGKGMFSLQPMQHPMSEAASFLRQMATETGGEHDLAQRLDHLHCAFARTGTWQPSADELTFGARLAWRNSVRCVGRMFWPSLKVFDARAARTTGDMFAAILDHIDWATNGGDIRPAITVFSADGPRMRILNS